MTTKGKQSSKTAPSNSGYMPFYRVDNLAEMMGLAETTLRKYMREGKLKGYKQAGRLYFLHEDVIAFITSGKRHA